MGKNVLFLLILSGLIACKNSTVESTNQNQAQTLSDSAQIIADANDPLMVATPQGYYQPAGLRKLNVLEMYNLGTGGEFAKDFPIKDKDGNQVEWSIMEDPAKPMFMQIYVDENGKAKEGVVYEINDEIKSLIMKVRMGSNQ